MNFIQEYFNFFFYKGFWFSLVYLILTIGVFFIFPSYIRIKFSRMPFVKYYTRISTGLYLILLILPFFYALNFNSFFFYLGVVVYLAGLFVVLNAIFHFALSMPFECVENGAYQYSRNPVYLGFSIAWLGISISLESFVLLLVLVFHVVATHQLILEEEKFTNEKYSDCYSDYFKRVNRYFGKG